MDVYLSEPHWTLDYQYRGVNTTKTAPALYDAQSYNAGNWRGGYGPQFGICNIDSGWPSDPTEPGVEVVNLKDGGGPNVELCPNFLTNIGNLNPTNQPQTLGGICSTYGKDQKDVTGASLGKPKWYESVCFPEEGTPGVLWTSFDASTNAYNAQYAMKIGCNFLPTELQTKLP